MFCHVLIFETQWLTKLFYASLWCSSFTLESPKRKFFLPLFSQCFVDPSTCLSGNSRAQQHSPLCLSVCSSCCLFWYHLSRGETEVLCGIHGTDVTKVKPEMRPGQWAGSRLCGFKHFSLSLWSCCQHSWLPVWEAHPLLLVPHVHRGHLQLPADQTLRRWLQRLRGNHHQRRIRPPTHPLICMQTMHLTTNDPMLFLLLVRAALSQLKMSNCSWWNRMNSCLMTPKNKDVVTTIVFLVMSGNLFSNSFSASYNYKSKWKLLIVAISEVYIYSIRTFDT